LSWWRGLDLNQRPPGYEPNGTVVATGLEIELAKWDLIE